MLQMIARHIGCLARKTDEGRVGPLPRRSDAGMRPRRPRGLWQTCTLLFSDHHRLSHPPGAVSAVMCRRRRPFHASSCCPCVGRGAAPCRSSAAPKTPSSRRCVGMPPAVGSCAATTATAATMIRARAAALTTPTDRPIAGVSTAATTRASGPTTPAAFRRRWPIWRHKATYPASACRSNNCANAEYGLRRHGTRPPIRYTLGAWTTR